MSDNPFLPPASAAPVQQSEGNPLQVPAIILLVMSSLMLIYGLFNIFVGLATGPPAVDPNVPNAQAVAMGQKIGFYGAVFLIPVINLLALLGSIAMLRLRQWPLAMAGAIVSLVPICGPCFILGIPIGIWCLILLNRKEVIDRFG